MAIGNDVPRFTFTFYLQIQCLGDSYDILSWRVEQAMVDVNDSLGKIEDWIQIVAIQGIWHIECFFPKIIEVT